MHTYAHTHMHAHTHTHTHTHTRVHTRTHRLLQTMQSTIRYEMTEAVVSYEEKARDQWLFEPPAQVGTREYLTVVTVAWGLKNLSVSLRLKSQQLRVECFFFTPPPLGSPASLAGRAWR